MQRCFDLARLGAGQVSPNPMVGAVLVHDGRIIGEGWHQRYGKAHAEVNCLASVKEQDRHLIDKSTLYVSLEPCCFHGKTPPCTDLILSHHIPKVVVCALDETPEVSGKGIGMLKAAGVQVVCEVLANEALKPSDFRNVFVSKQRPYIQLKFAKSIDGFMGVRGQQTWLSNHFSQMLAHKGRAAFDAILVGTNTALTDDPSLTNRHWFGPSPLRIFLDKSRRIPRHYHLLDGEVPTWVVCQHRNPEDLDSSSLKFLEMDFDGKLLDNLLQQLYEARITSLIVEGGAVTLQQFLDSGNWDEAAVFTAPTRLGTGIAAPTPLGEVVYSYSLGTDSLTILRKEVVSR